MPIAVVGAGRLGTRRSLPPCGRPVIAVSGPHSRGYDGAGDAVVLLCVPDDAIRIGGGTRSVRGPLVGHCSGVSGLDVLG